MDIEQLLSQNRTIKHNGLDLSKKQLLELLSHLVVHGCDQVKYRDILSALQQRERLGSTYMEHGVAIPHARVPGLSCPIAALVVLEHAIEYGEEQPADIILALVVSESAHESHIAALSAFADQLARAPYREALRRSHSDSDLYLAAIHKTAKQEATI